MLSMSPEWPNVLPSYTRHVNALSPAPTREVIASINLAFGITDPLAHFAVLTWKNTTQLQALWIEQQTSRCVGLTLTLDQKGEILRGTGYTGILDVASNQGHAVISRKESSSFVLKFEGELNSAMSAWELVDSVSSGTGSIYVGVTG